MLRRRLELLNFTPTAQSVLLLTYHQLVTVQLHSVHRLKRGRPTSAIPRIEVSIQARGCQNSRLASCCLLRRSPYRFPDSIQRTLPSITALHIINLSIIVLTYSIVHCNAVGNKKIGQLQKILDVITSADIRVYRVCSKIFKKYWFLSPQDRF